MNEIETFKPTGLNKRLKEMEEKLEQYEKYFEGEETPKQSGWDKFLGKKSMKKEFKLPRKVTTGKRRKLKQNYAIVLYIFSNGYADFFFEPIIDDKIYIRQTDKYHAATSEYVIRHKEFPMIIQPEWSLVPFSPREHSIETTEKGEVSFPQRFLIRVMKEAQLGKPKGFGGKTLLWIIIGAIVVLYLITQVITGGGTP